MEALFVWQEGVCPCICPCGVCMHTCICRSIVSLRRLKNPLYKVNLLRLVVIKEFCNTEDFPRATDNNYIHSLEQRLSPSCLCSSKRRSKRSRPAKPALLTSFKARDLFVCPKMEFPSTYLKSKTLL